jgi:hypothetical protein
VQQWKKDKEQLPDASLTRKAFCGPKIGDYEDKEKNYLCL